MKFAFYENKLAANLPLPCKANITASLLLALLKEQRTAPCCRSPSVSAPKTDETKHKTC